MSEGAIVGVMILLIFGVIGGVFGGICAAIASSKGRSVLGWFFGAAAIGIVGLLFTGPIAGIIMIILVACLPNLREKRYREEAIERENRRLREQLAQEQIKNEAFRRHTSARLDMHDVQIGVDTRAAVPALSVGMPTGGAPLLGHDPQQIPHVGTTAWPPMTVPPTAVPAPGVAAAGNAFPVAGETVVPNMHVNGNGHAPGGIVPASVVMPGSDPMQPHNGNGQGYGVMPPPPRPGAQAEHSVTPTREWHYEHQGATRGPVSDRQLVALAKSGEVTADTLLWTEQLGDWKPAGQIKPLQPHLRS